MFGKRNLVDVKKSTSKIQDTKKDLATKIKHLKIILDNVDVAEAKGLFEANFSHIYNILYDSFIQAETNLRQRELSFHLVHKAHKEELECSLWILEQVLCLLPELIHKRWQLHSLGRILTKLLHPGNSIKLRRQAIRYFLMWYQALNDNAPDYVHNMFIGLVPGFSKSVLTQSQHQQQTSGSIFHDTSLQHPITPTELLPILPHASGEKLPEHVSKFFLEALLEHMVNTVIKLEWQDKSSHHHRCFNFLLEKFKLYYLMKICPKFSHETSLYRPDLELPMLRKPEPENEFLTCRVTLIMWVANYMHQTKKHFEGISSSSNTHSNTVSTISAGSSSSSSTMVATVISMTPTAIHDDENQHESSHPSLDSTISIQTTKTTASDEELAAQIVREVLCSTRDNINFVHELYRQAFLMNFNHVIAIRKTIQVYKDLIQLNVSELPVYMLEPPDDVPRVLNNSNDDNDNNHQNNRSIRLRNDSYLGAIHKENLLIRAGIQNVYQLFMTHASNVFLLEINTKISKMLEEQTDACKRVLNIYRYMVMNTRMDSNTWEQLLLVLLQITSMVLGNDNRLKKNKKKIQTLGGKLAPAIFQTLIVTWIKANLNVMITRELWDRFLNVLISLTNWEELIKEWAKTLETLTRVLARHVYNLDLTDLPLDRLTEQKSKRGARRFGSSGGGIGGCNNSSGIGRIENNITCMNASDLVGHLNECRQDSSTPDGNIIRKRIKSGLSRSYSETNLSIKKRASSVRQHNTKHRRSLSLDLLPPPLHLNDTESTDRTRSPSPAPSSGLENNSIKDSPIQLDVLTTNNDNTNLLFEQTDELNRGVICGGTIRGWLPDVAVILWKRMLGALGDINLISEPKLHSQVFDYLIKLTETLIKIKLNQGITIDNQSTPQAPELIPPITLILPWCFGALILNNSYEIGKLNSLRLLCIITLNCDIKYRNYYLPYFYHFLHLSLIDTIKLNTCLKYLGPRFLSLQLPGSSLLYLDLVHSCNIILNTNDNFDKTPRTEAISILANLLSLPNLSSISVLQPENGIHLINCPDIKEHVVSILLKAGRREPTGKARCIALSALGIFVYKELMNQTFHPKVSDAINVLLLALKFNNKIIAQLASNLLYLLCDHAQLLWLHYPKLGNQIIRTLCTALFLHSPLGSTASENDKALETALLLCLGEWCMRLEPKHLLETINYDDGNSNKGNCLLLQIFTILHKIAIGKTFTDHDNSLSGLTQPSINDDFDPNIISDDLDKSTTPSLTPTKNLQCQQAIILCAKNVLSHLVTHLGHFPMAIGAARLSSLVVEHDDVPNLTSDELSANIFSAANIQLFMLSKNVIASLIELPMLDLPGGGVTAGLSTANKQVRVLLRDLSGKASWDASILYRTPQISIQKNDSNQNQRNIINNSSNNNNGAPMSFIQPESLMIGNINNLPQRAIRHRPPNILPDTTNAAPDLDQLDDLLQYLGHTSIECLENFDRKLNEPSQPPMSVDIEQEAIASVISQRNMEIEENKIIQHMNSMLGQPISRPNSRNNNDNSLLSSTSSTFELTNTVVEENAFQQCRLLFSQLGLASWERRNQLHLLNKTERLLRELRNLDNQRCRETHKVAVIYVGQGQEDKNSILSNPGGSSAYEQFLAGLAWEVELEGHNGFLGGLQRQGSNGLTAPYVATSFSEVIFHVATRMPGDTREMILNKTRHLGNDEVHIVWSEHNRDYRRDIIPTEFCDILITIYPLGNNLNRITVNCKSDVPFFGILFHEAIIESNILPGLVRATAICASRAKRTTLPLYQQYYEERARSLETVVTKHKNSTTFEDFISRVYSPIATPSPFCVTGSTTSGAGDGPACTNNPSMLAAALLDSHGHSHKPSQRSEVKYRASATDATRGVWFNNSDVSQNVESTSISPRPLKKISSSLKNVPRRSLRQDNQIESPPESPQQMLKKK